MVTNRLSCPLCCRHTRGARMAPASPISPTAVTTTPFHENGPVAGILPSWCQIAFDHWSPQLLTNRDRSRAQPGRVWRALTFPQRTNPAGIMVQAPPRAPEHPLHAHLSVHSSLQQFNHGLGPKLMFWALLQTWVAMVKWPSKHPEEFKDLAEKWLLKNACKGRSSDLLRRADGRSVWQHVVTQNCFLTPVAWSLYSVLVFYSGGTASRTLPGMFLVPPPPLEMSCLIFSSHTWKTTAPCSKPRMGTSCLVLWFAALLRGADPAPPAPLRSGWAQGPRPQHPSFPGGMRYRHICKGQKSFFFFC